MQRVIQVRELGPEISTHMQSLQELTHRAVREEDMGEGCVLSLLEQSLGWKQRPAGK